MELNEDLEQNLGNWLPPHDLTPFQKFSIPKANEQACIIGGLIGVEEEIANGKERMADLEAALDLLDDIIETCDKCKFPVPDYVDENYDNVARVYKKGKEQYFVFVDDNNEDIFEANISPEKVVWHPARKYKK